MTELEKLKQSKEAPEWLTDKAYTIISKGGYLLPNETPKMAYKRISKRAAELTKPEYESKYFEILWKGWLGLASPVFANMGTDRGLPISCFSSYTEDNMYAINQTGTEISMLSKYGGGTSEFMGEIRPKGSLIQNGLNGKSDGVVPFIKVRDSIILASKQGKTRRGAYAVYLPIEHEDFYDFVKIRLPEGDTNRQCLNIHHGVTITDEFMKSLPYNKENREKFETLLRIRMKSGEPYIFFSDTVNNNSPQVYKDKNLKVNGSNLCSEITGFSDALNTFVCCLSSMNAYLFDEWKNTDAVYYATWFLDGVMEEFIIKAKNLPAMERSVRFAKQSRMIGLGVFGLHSYFQKNMMQFGDLRSKLANNLIFKTLREETYRASADMAKELGEPELMRGYGMRNSHTLAVAPTTTNAKITGNKYCQSPGIEPLASNAQVEDLQQGSFIVKNELLMEKLDEINLNTPKIWKRIVENEGSVQHISEIPEEIKKVFLTAREINQFSLIDLAADRQKYIDQSQSLNLFFQSNVDEQYYTDVHLKAWKSGIKTLYYVRGKSVNRAESANREHKREKTSKEMQDDCLACEG